MKRFFGMAVCLLALGATLATSFNHRHGIEEPPGKIPSSCALCVGGIVDARAAQLPAPSALVLPQVEARRAVAPSLASRLDKAHSGNAPPHARV